MQNFKSYAGIPRVPCNRQVTKLAGDGTGGVKDARRFAGFTKGLS